MQIIAARISSAIGRLLSQASVCPQGAGGTPSPVLGPVRGVPPSPVHGPVQGSTSCLV